MRKPVTGLTHFCYSLSEKYHVSDWISNGQISEKSAFKRRRKLKICSCPVENHRQTLELTISGRRGIIPLNLTAKQKRGSFAVMPRASFFCFSDDWFERDIRSCRRVGIRRTEAGCTEGVCGNSQVKGSGQDETSETSGSREALIAASVNQRCNPGGIRQTAKALWRRQRIHTAGESLR